MHRKLILWDVENRQYYIYFCGDAAGIPIDAETGTAKIDKSNLVKVADGCYPAMLVTISTGLNELIQPIVVIIKDCVPSVRRLSLQLPMTQSSMELIWALAVAGARAFTEKDEVMDSLQSTLGDTDPVSN